MIPALGGSMLIPTIENEVFTNTGVEMDDRRFLVANFRAVFSGMKAASVLGTTRQSSPLLADGKSVERQLESSNFLPEAVRLRPVPPFCSLTAGSSPAKSGGLNGSLQHSPDVLAAGISMAKFVRER
jgi:hypothetical protein